MNMKKLNLLQAIGEVENRFREPNGDFWKIKWAFIYHCSDALTSIKDQILKDCYDTLKPYEADYARKRDLTLPFRGIYNVIIGCFDLYMSMVFVFSEQLMNVFALFFKIHSHFNYGKSFLESLSNFIPAVLSSCAVFGVRIAQSLTTLIQGLTQIAATPLSWFIKLPLRSLITLFTGSPKIEENDGIRKNINSLFNEYPIEMDTYLEIHRKFTQQCQRGQATDIINEGYTFAQLETTRSKLGQEYKHVTNHDINEDYTRALSIPADIRDGEMRKLVNRYPNYQQAMFNYRRLFTHQQPDSPPPAYQAEGHMP